jgi:hypothetical protein
VTQPGEPVPRRTFVGWTGRVGGAAAIGAVVGLIDASIWHWAAAIHACHDGGFCAGAGIPGIAYGTLVTVAGIWVGFAVLRIRPLVLSVPFGLLVTLALAKASGAAVPGGAGAPAWVSAVGLALGLALVALAMEPRRLRLAGMVMLVALGVAVLIVPGHIASTRQLSAQDQKLADLGFSLMLPHMAGYHAAGAYPLVGQLIIDMAPDGRDEASRPSSFMVTVAPTWSSYMGPTLEACAGGKQVSGVSACRPAGSNRWTFMTATGPEAIARYGDIAALAYPSRGQRVPAKTLLLAVSNLQPASISDVANLN